MAGPPMSSLLTKQSASTPPLKLTDPQLTAEWRANIRTMAARIARMRRSVFDALAARACPGDWSHILNQIGMFSYTGLTRAERRLLFLLFVVVVGSPPST